MKDVTIEEVEAAAGESTLAAVRCSMRHWLYNSIVESSGNINTRGSFCALCVRRQQRRRRGEFSWRCPLSSPEVSECGVIGPCCDEYQQATVAMRAGDLNGFKQAASALYVKLAKIEHDLMEMEAKDTKQERSEIMAKTTGELLKVLDLPEDKQIDWLIQHNFINYSTHEGLYEDATPIKIPFQSLADLAFRLRDERVRATPYSNRYAYDNALELVYRHERESRKEGTDKAGWGRDWSQPIHWIIAALIAKGE